MPLEYQPLDRTIPISLSSDSTVYHVTKEFGPATMGGMGTVLTAIAQAQLKTNKIKPNIVLPHYSFFNRQQQYPIKKAIDLAITMHDNNGKLVTINFRVSKFQYDFQPNDHFDKLTEEEKLLYTSTLNKRPTVTVYLIGNGKRDPFKKAYYARTITDIYSSPKSLPQEWRDQYFAKAASAFLLWKAAGKHEQSLFAPLERDARVDVVHLHGATNAYIAKYMHEFEGQMGASAPSIVYTMHDYLDELQYTNTRANVEKFLNANKGKAWREESERELAPYTFNSDRVFMSPLAIDLADAITFVSESMAKGMIEGDDFYLKEVIMPNLLQRAKNQQFYGISNGVDFESINPFTNDQLLETGILYPDYAKTLIDFKLQVTNSSHAMASLTSNYWTFSSQMEDYVIEKKRNAKKYLVNQGLLKEEDVDRPLVLYVGRFQYNKGLETFEEAAALFQQNDMKFAIIGQPNNYPLTWVKQLAAAYPDNIVLMTTVQEQHDYLVYFRAAADFVYVPSITESFGLVAAEGLLFGSSVISTGAGGLSEFLVDRETEKEWPAQVVSGTHVESHYTYNAYTFDGHSLAQAIQDAAYDYRVLRENSLLHEEYVLRMILSAYSLAWERPGEEQGPVYDYLRVYQQAIDEKKSKSKFNI